MKHLGFTESGTKEFSYNFYQIKFSERIATEVEEVENWEGKSAAEIEDMLLQKQGEINTDPEYHENRLAHDLKGFESQWMMDLYEQLEGKK
ncbi:hypothetical protein [Priestia megaterium]|uniref:hypothetical protein n=1 Tax=Priestia megaterium TaxID=1404 RepID=UPI001C250925|nr:hypothetical protein [Priestia megaterium]